MKYLKKFENINSVDNYLTREVMGKFSHIGWWYRYFSYIGAPEISIQKDDIRMEIDKERVNVFYKDLFKTDSKQFNFINISNIDPTERYQLLFLIKDKLVEMFCNYDFQKDFLEKTPNGIKDLEKIGYAPGIEEEFEHLINADNLGLL